jgi:vitamin B12 transporter
MRKNTSSHLRGAAFSLQPVPRVREKRVPGANVLARLPRAQPGGLQGYQPRVKRFLRHSGLRPMFENAPQRGAWIFTITFFLCGTFCFAQTTSLSITVVDQQQGAISNARVAVYPQGTSTAIRGTTNERGIFAAAVPSTRTFLLEVDADNFRKTSKVISGDEIVMLELAGIDSSIIVTAADTPQTTDEISKAITVVDSGEIEDRGEYSLTGVLSTIPGIQIHNVGGPGQLTTLRVRGLRSDSSAVLLDGMRFRDPSTVQGDASSFLSNLNIIAPDRVEVLRGSGSSLYGTNAASGVINIITNPGTGTTHGSIQAEGGNLGFARGRAQLGGGFFGDRLKYSAGLLHLNVMDGVDGNDRSRSTGGQALLNYSPTPQTMLSGRFWG